MTSWRIKLVTLSAFGVVALVGATAVLGMQQKNAVTFVRDMVATTTPTIPARQKIQHVATPEPLKAIYMSQCVVGTPSFRDNLVKLVDETELNALIIDIKDFSGGIAFPTENPKLKPFHSTKCGAYDMKDFVAMLHEKNIYVIGRITVFQDPLQAKTYPERAVQKKGGGVWKDHKGLAFIDVGSREHWDYIVELSKESYEMGFDELNYDYVRFPSDGPMAEAVYSHSVALGKTKSGALEEFFQYLNREVKAFDASTSSTGQPVVMSADLFGYVTVLYDDLGIGQVLERALPYFDYIAPMVYPSHYNKGFAGLSNVNSDPGKIVYKSMAEAVHRTESTVSPIYSFVSEKIASTSPQYSTSTVLYTKPFYSKLKMRPWLQAFDYPVPYTPQMVQDQIDANERAGLTSYYMWDAANKYTSLRKVLKPE